MANQLDLSQAEIAYVQSKIGPQGSTGMYSGAYQAILDINAQHKAQGLPSLDTQTEFWFQQAVGINGNDPNSSANLFIRDVTAAGLILDGKSILNIVALRRPAATLRPLPE
jgi:hypothetical protein